MAVKFILPDHEVLSVVANDMRDEDVAEVWAAQHHTPMESLVKGVEVSKMTAAVEIDGVPCAVLGLVVRDILSGVGVPWLLGSNEALKHRRHFITLAPQVLGEMLSICPSLYNFVHSQNTASVRWLKRIGFNIEDPQPYGASRDLFHRFTMEKN